MSGRRVPISTSRTLKRNCAAAQDAVRGTVEGASQCLHLGSVRLRAAHVEEALSAGHTYPKEGLQERGLAI